MNEEQEKAVKAQNATIAKAMLGERIIRVQFDNNNTWTGFRSTKITLSGGASVEFLITYDEYGEEGGLEIIVTGLPEDEDGKVFTWP